MANIKTTAREISNSGNIEYQVYHDQNIKNIINAFNDLVNQYQDHAFVGINVIGGKIQYVICSDKNKKIDAQAIISKINKVSNGTGGGKPDFAQGGSVNLDKIDDILSLLNKE
jgi:alanyl-tRNA synthetase